MGTKQNFLKDASQEALYSTLSHASSHDVIIFFHISPDNLSILEQDALFSISNLAWQSLVGPSSLVTTENTRICYCGMLAMITRQISMISLHLLVGLNLTWNNGLTTRIFAAVLALISTGDQVFDWLYLLVINHNALVFYLRRNEMTNNPLNSSGFCDINSNYTQKEFWFSL